MKRRITALLVLTWLAIVTGATGYLCYVNARTAFYSGVEYTIKKLNPQKKPTKIIETHATVD